MEACDALLMLGTDFPYRRSSEGCPHRPNRHPGRGDRSSGSRRACLVGQVGATLRGLLPRLSQADRSHLDAALKNYAEARKGLDDLAAGDRGPCIRS